MRKGYLHNLEVVVRGAVARIVDSKSVWEGAFNIVWMGAVEVDILHAVDRFNVDSSLESRGCLSQSSISWKVVFPE